MSTNNSFQKLAQEEEEQYPQAPPETERGVMGNVRALGFVSNVIELYLPKIFEMFISLFGGSEETQTPIKDNNKERTEDK